LRRARDLACILPGRAGLKEHPELAFCDLLQIGGEAERGVVRMLVNTLVCTTLGVLLVWAAA
jgi:hypothetical protein